MGVLTRAMKAKEENRFLERSAAFKIDALSTPGIVTQIASKLPSTDKSLKGLFRLINAEHYRHELQPFADLYLYIKTTKKREAAERRKRKMHEKRMLKIKPILERDIRAMVDIIWYCEGHMYKFVAVNALFHYFVDNLYYLKALGKSLGVAIRLKFIEILEDLERLEMFEERDQILNHRRTLQNYIRWATYES